MKFSSTSDLNKHRRAVRKAIRNSPVKLEDWFAIDINDKPREYIQMCQEKLFEKGYAFYAGKHESKQVRFDRTMRSILIYPLTNQIKLSQAPVFSEYIEVTLVDLYTKRVDNAWQTK